MGALLPIGAARDAVMDRLVTLFGGGGFVGRYVAQALYKTGARVRIAQRDPHAHPNFVKLLSDIAADKAAAAEQGDRPVHSVWHLKLPSINRAPIARSALH